VIHKKDILICTCQNLEFVNPMKLKKNIVSNYLSAANVL